MPAEGIIKYVDMTLRMNNLFNGFTLVCYPLCLNYVVCMEKIREDSISIRMEINMVLFLQ